MLFLNPLAEPADEGLGRAKEGDDHGANSEHGGKKQQQGRFITEPISTRFFGSGSNISGSSPSCLGFGWFLFLVLVFLPVVFSPSLSERERACFLDESCPRPAAGRSFDEVSLPLMTSIACDRCRRAYQKSSERLFRTSKAFQQSYKSSMPSLT